MVNQLETPMQGKCIQRPLDMENAHAGGVGNWCQCLKQQEQHHQTQFLVAHFQSSKTCTKRRRHGLAQSLVTVIQLWQSLRVQKCCWMRGQIFEFERHKSQGLHERKASVWHPPHLVLHCETFLVLSEEQHCPHLEVVWRFQAWSQQHC